LWLLCCVVDILFFILDLYIFFCVGGGGGGGGGSLLLEVYSIMSFFRFCETLRYNLKIFKYLPLTSLQGEFLASKYLVFPSCAIVCFQSFTRRACVVNTECKEAYTCI